MENLSPTTPEANRTPNVRSIQDNPGYFGAYLNMARHNVFLVLQHIYDDWKEEKAVYVGKEEELQNHKVISWLGNEENTSRSKYVYERLIRHFPFLSTESFSDPLIAKKHLILLLKKLSDHRNYCNHKYHNKHKIQNDLIPDLNSLLKKVFSDAIPLAQKRNAVYLGTNAAHAFSRLENNLSKPFYFPESSNQLGEKALAFLICLFLERRYAQKFLSRLSGFKRTDAPEFKATYLAYEHFCCQLPYLKLESKPGPGAVTLDIVNELHKVPDEIYQYLEEEDKKQFLALTEQAEVNNDQTTVVPPPVMKRYEDRFYYLAMRAMDEMDLMGTLRFQVVVGSKLLQKKDPKIILGQERPRILTQSLKAFYKLSNLVEVGNTQVPDFMEQYAPHYNTENNTISVSENTQQLRNLFGREHKKVSLKSPLAFISKYDVPQLAVYCLLHKQGLIATSLLDCINSFKSSFSALVNDIKQETLLPVQHTPPLKRKLHINHPKSAKAHTKKDFDKIEELTQRLDAVLKEKYKLTTAMLPDNIREYLLNYQPPSLPHKINSFFTRLQRENKVLLNRAENIPEDQKPKYGAYATWLASDMLQMSPPSVREHIRDFHYRELQSSLAYFSINKSAVRELITTLFLKDEKNKHPFIDRINIDTCRGILDFYKTYITKRQLFISSRQKEWNNIRKDGSSYDVFVETWGHMCGINRNDIDAAKQNKQYFSAINKILEKPTVIPRAYFNTPIVEALKKQNNEIDINKHNFTKALELYYNGDKQGFYDLKRFYKLTDDITVSGNDSETFNKEYQTFKKAKERISLPQHNRNSHQTKLKQNRHSDPIQNPDERTLFFRYKNKVAANEQLIRYKTTQDRTLHLLSIELIKNYNTDALDFSGFKLSQIEKYSSNILDSAINMVFIIKNQTIVLNTTMKRSGETRRYMRDRRIPGLLFYLNESKLSIDAIKSELDDYDDIREKITDHIIWFENQLQPHIGEWITETLEKVGVVQFCPLLSHLKKFYLGEAISQREIDELINIRNKFSHNEYYDISDLHNEQKNIASALYTRFTGLTDKILSYLNSL